MAEETSVDKILKNLHVAKDSGIRQISVKVDLANFINLSIKLDTSPSKCKIPKMKPLFEKGVKTEAKNYRPISRLPLIPKRIKKLIPDQTQDRQSYLQRNELLYIYQSGFRANPSTYTCLSWLKTWF